MTFLRQFYTLLEGRRKLLALSVGCGLLFAVSNLLPPLVIRRLIQWLTEGGGSREGLLRLALALLGVYALRGLTRYGYGRFSHVAAYEVMHDLLIRVYRHIQRLPHQFFHNQRTGQLISRSINDVEAVEDFVAHGIPESLLALVIPVTMMAVLFTLNAELALITLLPIPIVAYLVYRYVARVRQMWYGIRGRLGELVAQVQDHLAGISVIKSFVQENSCGDRIENHSRRFCDSMIQANTVSLIPSGLIEGAAGAGILLVLWNGGTMALSGHISVADLFVFVAYMAHIYEPFMRLASLNDVLQKASVSTDRVFELLGTQSDIVDAPGAVAPEKMTWSVNLEQVTFAYSPDPPVLHDINICLPEGQVVALVGPTGAGKSTVSSLLPRFFDPQEGSVRVGGHDVRNLPIEYLRQHISTVEQDIFLFHGTVRHNLLFGQPQADEHALQRAARAANAEEFLLDLPQGYDTVVGERGVRLSGGQKQRLSIARALLKDAPILILDEATSAVDTETERLIQEAITRLVANRTTLVIAHRLSTVRQADNIIVLNQGRIVDEGTHPQLLNSPGPYARMVSAQELTAKPRLKDEIRT